jgi:hypothetical protein
MSESEPASQYVNEYFKIGIIILEIRIHTVDVEK